MRKTTKKLNPRHWVSKCYVYCLFFLIFKEKNVHPTQWFTNKLLHLWRRKTKKLCTADILGPKWSATLEKSNVWFQIVMAKKFQGELRICTDPPEVNKALKRKDYTLPVLEAVLHEKGTQAWRLHTTSTGGCPSWTRHSSVKTTHDQCWRMSFIK